MSDKECVTVVVRCRPFSDKERDSGHENVVFTDKEAGTISVKDEDGASKQRSFTFDAVFDGESKQMQVYNKCARRLVESALEGFNSTIFAYGQTGTGKTHSMEGVRDDPELRGIIPNAFEHIFSSIQLLGTGNCQYLVRASYLEIYNEEIWDLLSLKSGKLDLKENPDSGVYVKNLSTHVIQNVNEAYQLMQMGNQNRSVAATNMNSRSSRSHSIFTITIECSERSTVDGTEHIRVGKLNLVDLAGSERQSKTGATGDRLKEAAKINLSLTALGNVISALVDGKSNHIPYRDSKLTRLLQDSLGGNARTLMVATLSPASYNLDETLSTLRYANRAKNIKNKPKINEDPKDALLREFQSEIQRLQDELAQLEAGQGADVNQASGNQNQADPTSTKKQSKRRAKGEARSSSKEPGVCRPHENLSEETLKKLQEAVEQEKNDIVVSTNILQEEKDRLLADLKRRSDEIDKEHAARNEISKRLNALQARLLVGGVNVLDKAAQQKALLERQMAELEEHAIHERELQRELESQDEQKLRATEKYNSLQEEAQAKEDKIIKATEMVANINDEMADLEVDWSREKESLLDNIRDLARNLRLQLLIIDECIPQREIELIENVSEYDEASQSWKIPHYNQAGNILHQRRRRLLQENRLANEGDESSTKLMHYRRISARRAHPEWYSPLPCSKSQEAGHLGHWSPKCVFENVFLSFADCVDPKVVGTL